MNMKKFYHKKQVTQEETPIILRLERRHTLMENAQDAERGRRASRSTSMGSMDGTSPAYSTPLEQSRVPPNDKSMSESIFSKASTVVITESELSSSWLYNNKKAQIAATEESPKSSKGQIASNSLENLIPETVQDPRLKSSSIPIERPAKQTSCCCYLTIALFICLATLGILTAIGGIIYMEIFTAYTENSQSATEILHNYKLGNETEVAYNEANRTLEDDQKTASELAEIEQVKIGSNTGSKSEEKQPSEHESNSSVSIHMENKFNQLKNQNSSTSVLDGKGSTEREDNEKFHEDIADVSMNNEISLPEMVPKEMSDQDKLNLFMKYNEETVKHFLNGNLIPRLIGQNSTSGTEVKDNGSMVEKELHSNLENRSISNIESIKNLSVPDSNFDVPLQVQGQLAYLPFDKASVNNEHIPEFDIPKENSNNLIDLKTDPSLPLNNHEKGKDISNDSVEKDPDSNDQNQIDTASNSSTQQHISENLTESKSVPFEFFQRLGFDRASMMAHPALTVEDMNVKFSLGDALKYLRSLDANNKPLTPRTKLHVQKTAQNNRTPKKIADIGKEREEYLMKLREKMYYKEN